MSRADDLLENLPEDVPESTPQVVKSNSSFTIDPVTRMMSNGTSLKNVIMQGDHESVTYTFKLPRYIDGHDMLQCNKVYVHWNNIGKSTGEESEETKETAESTEIYGLRINPDDTSTVICSWVITRNSTQLAGILGFLVEYKRVEDEKSIYEWHTDIYSDVEIRSGRDYGPQSVIEYSDILVQWENRIFGAGNSVMSDIAAAGESQKEAIAAKGEATLATIPADYTATHNLANTATRTKASAIVVTAEGEPIVAEDCSDDYLRGLHIYGRAKQIATTGAQLANLPDFKITLGGIVWTCAGGIVKAVGTCNAESSSTGNTIFHDLTGQSGTFYVSGSSSPAKVYVRVRENGTEKWYSDRAFTLTGMEESVLFYMQVADVGTVVDTTLYPMLNIGDKALPWEPYSGCVASPSPEWPQEIVSLKNPTVYIYGRNLIDFDAIEKSANTSLEISDDGYTITLIGGATYPYTSSHVMLDVEQYRGRTVIFKQDSVTATVEAGRGCAQLAVKTSEKTTYLALSEATPRFEVVIPDDIVSLTVGLYSNNTNAVLEKDNTVVIKGLMLAFMDGEWGPYKPIQTLPLNRTLPGIPVESGGNYTDSNGQQWIADEIDFERGVYIKRVHTISDWSNVTLHPHTYANDSYFVVYVGSSVSTVGTGNDVLCTHLIKCGGANLGNRAGVYSYTGSKNTLHISVPVSIATDVTALREWLIANNFVVAYAIAPIETPLTNEELLAFSKLHSNSLVTTALNSESAYMGLVYNADTKAYFEGRFNALLNTLRESGHIA